MWSLETEGGRTIVSQQWPLSLASDGHLSLANHSSQSFTACIERRLVKDKMPKIAKIWQHSSKWCSIPLHFFDQRDDTIELCLLFCRQGQVLVSLPLAVPDVDVGPVVAVLPETVVTTTVLVLVRD